MGQLSPILKPMIWQNDTNPPMCSCTSCSYKPVTRHGFLESLGFFQLKEEGGKSQRKRAMSLLWEKSPTWRWLVRRTRDSKPFFLAFATVCGIVPGVIGYCVMQATNSRNEQLEAHLRRNARPESLVSLCTILLSFLWKYKSVFGAPESRI